jgi:hypothetical protein
VKTETTTETEERYTPPTSMVPPIQLPMPMPQPQQFPTVVNDVNIVIRYPNGQTATWPANQPIPAGAVQVTNSNPVCDGRKRDDEELGSEYVDNHGNGIVGKYVEPYRNHDAELERRERELR